MGQEKACTAWKDGAAFQVLAQLESEEIRLRRGLKLGIPLSQVSRLTIAGDCLRIVWPDGQVDLELGASAAAKWLDKIRNPKSLLDKLGVKAGLTIAVHGVLDAGFLSQLGALVGAVREPAILGGSDLIFAALSGPADLASIAVLRSFLRPNGALWTVYPKGRKEIPEASVRTAALSAGLVDTKVAAFSTTHTAAKWMIPLASRAGSLRKPA